MEREDIETIRHMSETLDKMLVVLSKPEKLGVKALEIAGAIVGVLGILSIIDTIRSWIFGG